MVVKDKLDPKGYIPVLEAPLDKDSFAFWDDSISKHSIQCRVSKHNSVMDATRPFYQTINKTTVVFNYSLTMKCKICCWHNLLDYQLVF